MGVRCCFLYYFNGIKFGRKTITLNEETWTQNKQT